MSIRAVFLAFVLLQAAEATPENLSLSKTRTAEISKLKSQVKRHCSTALLTLLIASLATPVAMTITPHQWYSGRSIPKTSIINSLGQSGWNHWLVAVMQNLTPVQLIELGHQGIFASVFNRNELSLEYLKRLRSEMYLPTRFSKIYTFGNMNDQAREALEALIFTMEATSTTSIKAGAVLAAADERINLLKADGTIGNFYRLHSIKYPRLLLTWDEVVVLSSQDQKKLEASFSRAKEIPLTDREQSLISAKLLTATDIYQLRGLRKAAEIFERASPVKGLARGGSWNNYKAELIGGNRQVCVDCTATYQDFTLRLQGQGFLSNFTVVGPIRRPWGLDSKHVALELKSQSGESFVLDAWHENGGIAPHIVTTADWRMERDFEDIVTLLSD